MRSGRVSGKHQGFFRRALIKSVQLQRGQELRRGVSDVCPSVNCDIWSAAKPLRSCRACQRTAWVPTSRWADFLHTLLLYEKTTRGRAGPRTSQLTCHWKSPGCPVKTLISFLSWKSPGLFNFLDSILFWP